MVKGRLPCLFPGIDQNELMPAGNRPPVDEAIRSLNPLDFVRQVEDQAPVLLLEVERPLIIGRADTRAEHGGKQDHRQKNGRQPGS